MARKQKQVVRIVLPDGMNRLTDEVRQLVEQLRYAGIATVHRDNEEGLCFDLHCPGGLMDRPWAEMNAARMRSFTYNAVAAPGTAHLDDSIVEHLKEKQHLRHNDLDKAGKPIQAS